MPAVIQDTVEIVITITSDATGGLNFTVPRACIVTDVHVIATAAGGGAGTVTVSKAGSAITAALACDVANTLTRAAAITQANSTFAAGEVIRVVGSASAVRGIVVVSVQCTPAPALTAV